MSDTLGVLGRASVAAQGVQTVYECPTGYGVKCKIQYRGVCGSGSTLAMIIAGMTIFQSGSQATGNIQYSSYDKIYNNATAAADINGSSANAVVAPYIREYMLKAGDQVKYSIAAADYSSFQMDVIGVAADLS